MSEKQWEMIRRLLKQKGYRSIEKRREQINAVLYLVKTGCQWRNLPKDFPNWKTVYSFYRRACLSGTWDMLQKELVKEVFHNLPVDISPRIKNEFEIQPLRWIVERTFSWFNGSRRLSKDYEIKSFYQENICIISNFATLLRRF